MLYDPKDDEIDDSFALERFIVVKTSRNPDCTELKYIEYDKKLT